MQNVYVKNLYVRFDLICKGINDNCICLIVIYFEDLFIIADDESEFGCHAQK